MENLIDNVKSLPLDIKKLIDLRIEEFASFKTKPSNDWFSELCFCLMTANARAKTALAVQRELGANGFLNLSEQELVNVLLKHKHRFHNVKSSRIVEARKHTNVKETIQDIVLKQGQIQARDWLVKNVKGLGLKEASHFLRNTGHENVAIIDRHIIAILKDNKLLEEDFQVKSSNYLQAEQVCQELGKKLNMSLSKLDLSLWYLKTGEVLK